MSHSAARLSSQMEICLKWRSTRILRPVAFRHPITRGLAFLYLLVALIINARKNRAQLSDYSLIAWISYAYVNYGVKTGKIIH